jgi:uncharacterized protein involved in exopolysaccharide biosynthesis
MLLQNDTVKHLIHSLTRFAPVWIGSAAVLGCLSLFYVVFLKGDTYNARQQLSIRDNAIGSFMSNGEFESSTAMKVAQELVLEMATNKQVVKEALVAMGPERSWFGTPDFPSTGDVSSAAENSISVRPPKGKEFGSSELLYLDAKASSPERATALNAAVCDALQSHLQKLREIRSSSVITELESARETAISQLATSTEQLQTAERKAGSDLSDLRGMTDMGGTSSNSRILLDQLKNELRSAETNQENLVTSQQLLLTAVANPKGFITAPGDLINNQPGLKRLREGLVDNQLNASQLAGLYTDSHPSLIAARSTVTEITNRLVAELRTANSQIAQEVANGKSRINRLIAQIDDQENRLDRLADVRASYSNLVSEVKTRATILEETERRLAAAQASRDSASSISLVAKVNAPQLSDGPIGPGRLTIVVVCTFAGLVGGVGLVVLISPPPIVRHGRRSSDHSQSRSSDRMLNSKSTRGTDRENAAQPNLVETPQTSPLQTSPIQTRLPETAASSVPSPADAADPVALDSMTNRNPLGDATVSPTVPLHRPPTTADELRNAHDRRVNPRSPKPSPLPPVNLGFEFPTDNTPANH